MAIVNVTTANTFEEWRVKTNEVGTATGDLTNLTEANTRGTDVIGALTDISTNLATAETTIAAIPATYVDVAGDTMTGDLNLGDDDKIKIGIGADLQIYHDATNSIIKNATGITKVQGDDIQILDAAGTETLAKFVKDGAVELYHNNVKKVETTTAGATVTGNIVVTGTVDGRDMVTDGTKLDLIEASATADQTNAEIRTAVEAATDSNVFTDADHTLLNGLTTNFVNVTGDTMTGTLKLNDSVKAIYGTGNDLEIYHDGSNSYIKDVGDGDLIIQGQTNLKLQDGEGHDYLTATNDGAVSLFWDNASKISTTNTGVTVTGTITPSGQIITDTGVFASSTNTLKLGVDSVTTITINDTDKVGIGVAPASGYVLSVGTVNASDLSIGGQALDDRFMAASTSGGTTTITAVTDFSGAITMTESLTLGTEKIYQSGVGGYTLTGHVRGKFSVTDAGGDGSCAYNSSTGVITYTGPSAAEVQAHISVTDAGGDGSLSYSSGVITYTGPSAAQVRAHLSAGTGITYSAGEISIGQAVGTTDSVQFDDVVVSGDLTINGTTTTVASTNTTHTDALIEYGTGTTGTPANDAGIVIERGDQPNAFIGYDESADKFTVGTGSFTGASTGNLTITTGTLVANLVGNVTGAVTGNADTATAWATGRTVGMTGDVVWTSASLTGTGNVTGTATIQTNAVERTMIIADAIDGTKIADDAINSEHYAAGSIDLEHMNSESVDEDNLKISNAGSNGQFLSKQSGNTGGLTWAVPTNTNTTYTAGQGLTLTGTVFSNNLDVTQVGGYDDIGLGSNALANRSNGNFNVAVGTSSLRNLTTTDYNTAVGYSALFKMNTGQWNTAVGANALMENTSGENNTAVGAFAMDGSTIATIGSDNTAVGLGALGHTGFSGSQNVGIGSYGGSTITSGDNNIVIGYNAQAQVATADNQINIGNRFKYAAGTAGPSVPYDFPGMQESLQIINSAGTVVKRLYGMYATS